MPSATAREFQRAAARLGSSKTRQTGGHERWNHPDGRAVTIAIHGGKEVGPPLFFKILRQMGYYTTINGDPTNQPHVSQVQHVATNGQTFSDAQLTYTVNTGVVSPFTQALPNQPITA